MTPPHPIKEKKDFVRCIFLPNSFNDWESFSIFFSVRTLLGQTYFKESYMHSTVKLYNPRRNGQLARADPYPHPRVRRRHRSPPYRLPTHLPTPLPIQAHYNPQRHHLHHRRFPQNDLRTPHASLPPHSNPSPTPNTTTRRTRHLTCRYHLREMDEWLGTVPCCAAQLDGLGEKGSVLSRTRRQTEDRAVHVRSRSWRGRSRERLSTRSMGRVPGSRPVRQEGGGRVDSGQFLDVLGRHATHCNIVPFIRLW